MSSLSIIEYHFLRPVYRCQYNVNSHLYIGSTIACQSQRSSEHGNFLSFYRSVCLNNKPIVLLLLTLSPSQPVKRQPERNQLMYCAGLTSLSCAITHHVIINIVPFYHHWDSGNHFGQMSVQCRCLQWYNQKYCRPFHPWFHHCMENMSWHLEIWLVSKWCTEWPATENKFCWW